jgi:hypothetical protein
MVFKRLLKIRYGNNGDYNNINNNKPNRGKIKFKEYERETANKLENKFD